MIVALIDNGSLEPAAHRNLRAVAAGVSRRTGVSVHAVSWKHSDRIPAQEVNAHTSEHSMLDTTASASGVTRSADSIAPVWTLAPFVRAMVALGQREFVFVPFFISAQGAIGSALRSDLEHLQRELGETFEFNFTEGLATRGAVSRILAERIRNSLAEKNLPPGTRVVVVDHGGPSLSSALLRNELAADIRRLLDEDIGILVAASMEGGEHPHCRPLLADVLADPGFDQGDVVIAPLFLSPGRHAGPRGDLAEIARAAEDRLAPDLLRCHFTELVGTHPLAVDTLADALRDTLSTLHAYTSHEFHA